MPMWQKCVKTLILKENLNEASRGVPGPTYTRRRQQPAAGPAHARRGQSVPPAAAETGGVSLPRPS